MSDLKSMSLAELDYQLGAAEDHRDREHEKRVLAEQKRRACRKCGHIRDLAEEKENSCWNCQDNGL